MTFLFRKPSMPDASQTLAGRSEAILPAGFKHYVNGRTITPPYPEGLEVLDVAMGCFWGAEQAFWTLPGVYVTAVGYQGGTTPNPTYRESCSGKTGHAEAVRIVFDPKQTSFRDIFQQELSMSCYETTTTEIREAPEFYFAEDDHQQYLAKNPGGYCGLGGTGVSCPIGLTPQA